MQPSYLSNEELERYWFQYKTEAEIHGTPLEKFCRDNKISYKALDNWRRQTKNKIYPVQIIEPEINEDNSLHQSQVTSNQTDRKFDRHTSCRHRSQDTVKDEDKPVRSPKMEESAAIRIMVTIKATNGLYIAQRNLDYTGLLNLVEKLEGLC